MLSLKKIFQLFQGTNLQDAHELPVSEGESAGQTKKYNIGQIKAYIWAYVQTQIENISQGPQGPQGATGAQGVKGEKGDKGDRGDKGDAGLKGDVGPQGLQGIQGAKGDKGDTGAQGPQGIQGVQGEKGEKGDQGDAGLNGDTGADGVGVPTGGLTGQVLAKKTDDDHDTEWVDQGSGGASSFAELAGSPDDNAALAGKFTTVENLIDDEAAARVAADDAYLLLAQAYADLVATDVLRFAGNWDASVGTYPTTGTGSGGAIRRGDSYDISVAGTIDGNDYEVGDQLRAKIAAPGQTTANWASGQVNTQQATTTKVGIARMANSSEAVAALNALLMSNPVTVLAQILAVKKNYIKECYVLSVMEIIFPMELAGQFTALACSTAMSNLQYKIGVAGTYTTFSTPVSYAAGNEIYLKWDYTSPTEQRGWLRMIGKDS